MSFVILFYETFSEGASYVHVQLILIAKQSLCNAILASMRFCVAAISAKKHAYKMHLFSSISNLLKTIFFFEVTFMYIKNYFHQWNLILMVYAP